MKVVAIAVCLVTITACDRRTRVPRVDTSDTPENQALLTKLQPYIRCLDHGVRVFEIADSYRLEPTTLQASPDPKNCIADVRDIRAFAPLRMDLDAAGQAYNASLANVFTLTTSATESPAKAAQLAPELRAAFTDFDARHGALFDIVFEINHQIHLEQLARREQRDGTTLMLKAERTMLGAEELVRMIAVKFDRLDRLDLPALRAKLAVTEAGIETTTGEAIALPDEGKTQLANVWTLRERGKAFIVSVRQLIARAEARVPLSEAEKIMIAANNEVAIVGSPAAAVHAYNQFVDAYQPVSTK